MLSKFAAKARDRMSMTELRSRRATAASRLAKLASTGAPVEMQQQERISIDDFDARLLQLRLRLAKKQSA